MHFMVIRRADADSESGDFPAASLVDAVPAARWLHPGRQATRLHRSAGAWSIEHGPFPASELAAGFAIVDVASKEEAMAWPTADAEGDAVLEVRETGCTGGCAGIDAPSPPPAPSPTKPHPAPAHLPAPHLQAQHLEPARLEPYAVLIRSSDALEADLPPPPDVIARMNARNARDAQAGVLLAGDGLKGTAKGARVKFKGGRPSVVDGPFTEIKELIAGFWLIQAASRDEAIAWVKSYPFPWPDVTLELRALACPLPH